MFRAEQVIIKIGNKSLEDTMKFKLLGMKGKKWK